MTAPAQPLDLRTSSAAGRWVIAAAVLGSGVAFLDSTVVNAALPSISNDLGADLAGIQWVLSAYLLTLGSLVVIGGSLGDRWGRKRVFVIGLVGFALTSLLCGASPTIELLIAARALQGVAAALLVPGSLAIVSASFHPDDRGRAIGAWAGLAGVSSALGPFLGATRLPRQPPARRGGPLRDRAPRARVA
jgi:MFS family permease